MGLFGIFLSHAGSSIKWPALGVAIFYTLSGFLMYRKHSSDDLNLSLKNRAKFSWSRISKLYPLHIITMCFAVVLEMAVRIHGGLTFSGVVGVVAKIFLNVTLTQTWIPHKSINFSLNGVAWFLSVALFLYFMFPPICMWIKNACKRHYLLLMISIGILIVEVMVCIPWIIIVGADNPIYIWFMYCFPVFRMGDFFIGCSLAKYYLSGGFGNHKQSIVLSSAIESMALIATIAVLIFRDLETSNVLVLAIKNWTTIYILLAVLWIILFAENKGVITYILSNRVTIFIGNISAYLFLIHYVVTRWTREAMNFFDFVPDGALKIIFIAAELALSVFLSVEYKRYKAHFQKMFIAKRAGGTVQS